MLLPSLVATGFPAGQTPLKSRLEEIRLAVADGAAEIDIVINRDYALSGNWKGMSNFLGLVSVVRIKLKSMLRLVQHVKTNVLLP